MKFRTPLFNEAGAGDAGGGSATILGDAGAGGQQQSAAAAPAQNGTDGDGNAVPFDFRQTLDDKGSFKQGWQDTLPDGLKEFSGILGKYPNPVELARALGHSQKLISQKQQAGKPPGPDAKPEEVAAWRKTLGVPDKPEDYGIKAPEKLPDGVKWDDAEAANFSKFAHEIGLTPQQAQKLIEYDVGIKANMYQAGSGKLAEYVEAQKKELAAEWGDKFQDNAARALNAAQILGLDANDPEIGNSAKMIKALYTASQLISEDKLVGSGRGGSGMTNKQMADDIMVNPSNPWNAAYMGKEGEARQKEAQKQRLNLLGVKL